MTLQEKIKNKLQDNQENTRADNNKKDLIK
jgi:hypothetical protein